MGNLDILSPHASRGETKPLILILSSHVAASPVGGSAQVVALAACGIEAVLIPTVLFGRHPGLGPPGGGPVPTAMFEGMLRGAAAAGVFERADAVIAGYFADAEQVAAAGRTLDAVRKVNPRARFVVDPIMGDRPGGLYVPQSVAEAIGADLAPRADLIAPNAWELERLTGRPITDPVAAARSLGRAVLVSSVDLGEEIGVIYADTDEAWLAAHLRSAEAPKGAGDRLTALFTAAVVLGRSPKEALESAVTAVAAGVLGPTAVRLEAL